MRRVLNGDKQAIDALVRKHYQDIYRYCVRRIGVNDAADLTQEIFLRLTKALFQYRFTGKFSNFLFTIAVNACTDYERRKPRVFVDIEDVQQADDGLTPFEAVLLSERAEIVNRRLDALPDIQKDAIILHYYHGFKIQDIAKITGVSLPTAKSRLKQGMDKLRKTFGEEDYFEESR